MYAHAETLRSPQRRFVERINGPYHELALRTFMVVVLAHWAEHLLQAFQIYVLGWPVPEARGLLGYYYPWLIKSETLHYGYAVVMLAGLWLFRPGFTGVADRRWWTIALAIQFFHHIEHFLLLAQAASGSNLLGRPVPTSIIQLWVPRVELHLFYNTIVFIPMIIGMYYHLFPPPEENVENVENVENLNGAATAGKVQCTCAWNRAATA